MDRLKIFILNNVGNSDFIGSTYVDVQSAMGFLRRQRRLNNFSVIATKGKRTLYMEKIDAASITRELTEFAIAP